MLTDEMRRALALDGDKLRQLTGQDHGPHFIVDRVDPQQRLAALDWAADAIKAQDGGDMTTDTGWASDEALSHWLTIHTMIEEAEQACLTHGAELNKETGR
jgi:hypothetical protein